MAARVAAARADAQAKEEARKNKDGVKKEDTAQSAMEAALAAARAAISDFETSHGVRSGTKVATHGTTSSSVEIPNVSVATNAVGSLKKEASTSRPGPKVEAVTTKSRGAENDEASAAKPVAPPLPTASGRGSSSSSSAAAAAAAGRAAELEKRGVEGLREACNLYARAAAQGHSGAQHNLARLVLLGWSDAPLTGASEGGTSEEGQVGSMIADLGGAGSDEDDDDEDDNLGSGKSSSNGSFSNGSLNGGASAAGTSKWLEKYRRPAAAAAARQRHAHQAQRARAAALFEAAASNGHPDAASALAHLMATGH